MNKLDLLCNLCLDNLNIFSKQKYWLFIIKCIKASQFPVVFLKGSAVFNCYSQHSKSPNGHCVKLNVGQAYEPLYNIL